jgi:hypothetical protein
VVASGPAPLAERAALALRSASQDFCAQFILVSQEQDPRVASSIERSGAEFVSAPVGSTRAEMCDLGMSRASGSIVAVRDDVAVGDARWLETYRAILPARSGSPRSRPAESVLMDTMAAGQVIVADSATLFATTEPKARGALRDMAALA